jgi:hypothetical protein
LAWSDVTSGVLDGTSAVRHDEWAATSGASIGVQVQLPPLRSNYSLARLHRILTMKRCLAAFAIAAISFLSSDQRGKSVVVRPPADVGLVLWNSPAG